MYIFVKVLLGILLQIATGQSSNINDTHFVAGVVEFRPDYIGLTTEQMVAKHTEAYIEILKSEEAFETDIVVFPESTLNAFLAATYVPAPKDSVIPCLLANQMDRYENFLKQISCSARSTRKYVVINLTERENCSANAAFDRRPCAPNDLNIYNTNVVFDRDGRVISRYRKVNIYLSESNTTYKPEYAIFDTDFGVRFAHFICFDLLFYTPAEELVVKHGIRNIIYTTMFVSEAPFLTAVQLQQAWAWGNNVTLLAAGGSRPKSGSTGSGIYIGSNGALTAAMFGYVGVRKLYVAKVPKLGANGNSQTNIQRYFDNLSNTPQTFTRLLRDPQLDNFKSKLFQFNSSSTEISMQQCFDELCCNLVAETIPSEQRYGNSSTAIAAYKYRFGIYKGQRSYEKEQYSQLSICAIYACTNDKVASCGLLFPANTTITPEFTFKRLKITGSFVKASRLLLMPTSLNFNFYPLQPEQLQWKVAEKGKSHAVSIDLKVPANNLLSFGIYANYYDSSAAPKYSGCVMLLLSSMSIWAVIFAISV